MVRVLTPSLSSRSFGLRGRRYGPSCPLCLHSASKLHQSGVVSWAFFIESRHETIRLIVSHTVFHSADQAFVTAGTWASLAACGKRNKHRRTGLVSFKCRYHFRRSLERDAAEFMCLLLFFSWGLSELNREDFSCMYILTCTLKGSSNDSALLGVGVGSFFLPFRHYISSSWNSKRNFCLLSHNVANAFHWCWWAELKCQPTSSSADSEQWNTLPKVKHETCTGQFLYG